jgi:hypothetical protein
MSRARDRADGDFAGKELIFDADGDTSITADTDDQIDIRIAGADDFKFTANTLTALSGSSVATNTISETTSASGVTIDSVLLKDGNVEPTGSVRVDDSQYFQAGDSYDLQMYHDGSNSFIEDQGTGDLILKGTVVRIRSDNLVVSNAANNEDMITAAADGAVNLRHNNVSCLTTTSDGGIDIEGGDIFFSTAGKGINLGVTSNTDSNTLDDYEEGECSLTMGGLTNISTSAANIQANNDYSGGQAHYVKVGTLCYVQAYFFSQATSTQAAGDLVIQGLPFSAAGNGGNFTSQSYNLTLPAGVNGQQVAIFQAAGSTQLNGQLTRSGATWASVQASVMPNGSAIYFRIAGTYRTA